MNPIILDSLATAAAAEIAPILSKLWELEMPQLLTLGRAILDAIEQKGAASTIANAAVQAEEVAADMAEGARFPKP